MSSHSELTAEDRDAISSACAGRMRRVGPRRDVVLEGAERTSALVLFEGWAVRHRTLADGRRQIVSLILPGDVSDGTSFFFPEADFAVSTLTSATFCDIPRGEVERLAASYCGIRAAFAGEMLVSAAIQREWTVSLGQRNASERLAHLFCEIFHRLRAVGLAGATRCPMPIRQSDLASATGVSEVHLNRTIRGLREAGLVVLDDRELTIPDLAALEDMALFEVGYLHLRSNEPLLGGGGRAQRRPDRPGQRQGAARDG